MSKSGEPNVQIEFGAMAPPIGEQLAAIDGFEWEPERFACYQKLADAVTLLAVQGLLTFPAKDAARRKLAKVIARDGVAK